MATGCYRRNDQGEICGEAVDHPGLCIAPLPGDMAAAFAVTPAQAVQAQAILERFGYTELE